MRELTIDEQFMRIATIEKQREAFIACNTSPLMTYRDGIGIRLIRYAGALGHKNTFGLDAGC